MAYQFTNVSTIEPVSAADGMLKGNAALYNVISGCTPTYSGANMTVTCAAGTITHNGAQVTVTGGASFWTLIADSSNPRWTWLSIDSSGAAVVVSGTPAATPAVPALGDRVAIALVKVEAGQTVADNITTKIDKRTPAYSPYAALNTTEATMTGASATDLVTLSNLNIPAGKPFRLKFAARKTAGAASTASFPIKINSTAVFAAGKIVTSVTDRAESGLVVIEFWPGETNYQSAVFATAIFYTSAGAVATSVISGAYALDALMPSATVTSITIQGRADTGMTAAVKNVVLELL